MDLLINTSAIAGSASLLAWVWLVFARGMFWRTDLRLEPGDDRRADWPEVAVVVPARDEAAVLPITLPTLLGQDYPGRFHVFLVDDQSGDGTAAAARRAAAESGSDDRLTVVPADPPPPGWTGKLSALRQGVRAAEATKPEFLLLTDADIVHPPDSLRALVRKAQAGRLDLVSLMARLRVETVWERMLIPAFVYFFAKLYPFRWSNDPRSSTAAAAGGCVLVRRDALENSGGLEAIAGELIDDCALAALIKRHARPEGGKTWLGLSQTVRSIRAYDGLGPVWHMVARTAYAQLDFSPLLLVGTVVGMLFLYLVPPLSTVGGVVTLIQGPEGVNAWLGATGLAAWCLMAGSFVPMLRWHGASPLLAPLLPLTAVLYTLMTVDSARRWRRGQGGAWKGRVFSGKGPHTKRPS